MDARGPAGGMPRRAFLAAALGSVAAASLAGCTDGGAPPSPTPSPTPTGAATPTPTASPGGVPRPVAFQRSRWSADPFMRGAFSFDSVGATPDLRRALGEPVEGRLVIAGEATSPDAPGTVHGAYAEGLRAARAIADLADEGDRIAVIGAGIAGLAAARTLADEGFEVVVIEAGEHLGGRLRSVEDRDFGAPVELGSPFVSDGGVMRSVLADSGVATRPFTPRLGSRTPEGVAVASSDAGWAVIAEAQAWAASHSTDTPLSTALVRSGAVPVSDEPGPDALSERDWFVNALTTGVEPTTGASATRVSAQRFDPALVWHPTDQVTSGWTALIEDLGNGLDIAGSSAVTDIAVDADGVSLRLDSGESLRTHRLIVTASIGVLRTDTVTFDPPLPLLHQRAISTIAMGALDLVWLRFDEAFWRSATDAPGTPPPVSEAPNVLTLVGATPTVAAWLDLGADPRRPVLVGMLAAEHARRIAELDDDAALEVVLEALEPFATVA
ncbi:FAD-dependent oxidoreductase [Agromyces aurantiacus]|uniref:FAD-dependent oxidoreductase n=1 Tax=Agromyces aurantiacus TaxID=165814 RepID=A0ABV9R5H3_9MICO|nr:FAD-dependent oxidoreductase [Agromyces aurantiacus]MBM7503396.1 monoamine oxidase [Agromyces aurantiacus]